MIRQPLLELLARYANQHPDESECLDRVRALVTGNADCFERTCMPGHITASVWIASPDHRRFLLTHHRKLDRWLQLGGHADGDPDVRAVALCEAREESGMTEFSFARDSSGLDLIDVDVHRIPPFRDEPAHDHHDLRFCLVAKPGQQTRISAESLDLKWFDVDRLDEFIREESLLRLARKSLEVLGDDPVG